MADPISFDPYLGWVNITDPNNIPADAHVISANDLLRYENFAVAAKDRINSHDTLLTTHDTLLTGHGTALADAAAAIAQLQKLRAIATKTASYTTTAADSVIIGNGTALTITLISAVTATAGKVFTIKNQHSTALTVASTAGTIDGAATRSITQWGTLTVISDGANWFAI